MGPLATILGLVDTVVTRLFPDKSASDKAALALALQESINESQVLSKQIDVNAEQAKSSSLFVSGGRPFIMWVCGAAFAWAYCFQPMLIFLLVASGHDIPKLPAFDLSVMMPVLFGLLGLGGMRSFEKSKGVAR